MAYTIAELREITDADLIREHDARTGSVVLGIDYFLQELARRDSARVARQLLWLTVAITACTIVMTVATVVLVYRAT